MNIEIDITSLEKMKSRMGKRGSNIKKVISTIVAKAAFTVEAETKRAAQQLVYGSPPSPNYQRTGRLLNSIITRLSTFSAEIYPTVTYAKYVEFGTRYMESRPFMQTGSEVASKKIKTMVKEEIKNAIKI